MQYLRVNNGPAIFGALGALGVLLLDYRFNRIPPDYQAPPAEKLRHFAVNVAVALALIAGINYLVSVGQKGWAWIAAVGGLFAWAMTVAKVDEIEFAQRLLKGSGAAIRVNPQYRPKPPALQVMSGSGLVGKDGSANFERALFGDSPPLKMQMLTAANYYNPTYAASWGGSNGGAEDFANPSPIRAVGCGGGMGGGACINPSTQQYERNCVGC